MITDDNHPLAGKLLISSYITGEGDNEKAYLVQDAAGELKLADETPTAELFVTRQVTLHDGSEVTVKSSFQCLKEAANRMTLEEYSQRCHVPVKTIESLGKALTSYDRKAAVISHGGMMGGNGFYTAWSVIMLNALIGNLNLKGGVSVGGGKFNGKTMGRVIKLPAIKAK